MVRPILEYACSAWSLYTQVNINKLEMVQHCAACLITGNYSYQHCNASQTKPSILSTKKRQYETGNFS